MTMMREKRQAQAGRRQQAERAVGSRGWRSVLCLLCRRELHRPCPCPWGTRQAGTRSMLPPSMCSPRVHTPVRGRWWPHHAAQSSQTRWWRPPRPHCAAAPHTHPASRPRKRSTAQWRPSWPCGWWWWWWYRRQAWRPRRHGGGCAHTLTPWIPQAPKVGLPSPPRLPYATPMPPRCCLLLPASPRHCACTHTSPQAAACTQYKCPMLRLPAARLLHHQCRVSAPAVYWAARLHQHLTRRCMAA